MKKLTIFLLTALLLTIALSGCGGNESKTGPAAKAAKNYFYEAKLNAPVENVEVLSVEMEDKEHAMVKVKVSFGKGASWMPSEENFTVFLNKYGNEWEVKLCN